MPFSFTSVLGYEGSISDVDYSKNLNALAARYTLATSTALAPTVTAADRTVQYAAGTLHMGGMRATLNAATTLQHTANGGGSDRYDLVVARFDFSANTAVVDIVTGTIGAGQPPTATFDFSNTYEVPIIAVKVRPGVGPFVTGDIIDLRPYGGRTGPTMLPQGTFANFHDFGIGDRYKIAGGLTYEKTGTSTYEAVDSAPYGHSGITSGFVGIPGSSGVYPTLANQELGDGMTWSSNGLVVPKNGRYRITFRGYASGGSAWSCEAGATKNTTATPPASFLIASAQWYKATTDDYRAFGTGTRTLVAGDTVRLWIGASSTSWSTWGTDGYNGAWLEVEWVRR